MADLHITQLLLTARSEGEITEYDFQSLLLDHLQALCPHCQEELERYAWSQKSPMPLVGVTALVGGLVSSLATHRADLAEKHQTAQVWADELASLSHKERIAKQKSARKRFRGPVFALTCIERAHSAVSSSIEDSRNWAYLAQFATMHPDCEPYPELEALALAYQSNALRVAGNFEAGKTFMEMAHTQMQRQGVVNPSAVARIFSLSAALRIDLREYKRADKLLQRSEMLYRLISLPEERTRVLIQQGVCYAYSGRPEKAYIATLEAIRTLPANVEPRLALCVRHNHALYLCELERYDEAETILEEGAAFYRAFPDARTQTILAWLKGKIAFGHGALDAAERLFEETRASYQHQKLPYDAALVSLDLALVYAEQLRTDELRALTDEMVHTFTRYELHHEAVAALILLKQTVYTERALTVTTVRRLARFLEQERSHLRPRKRPLL